MPLKRRLIAALAAALFSVGAVAEDSAWVEYSPNVLKSRQTKGHLPLISTAAIATDDGFVVISDFGQKSEHIRCFDTFDKSYRPVGTRVCWRR